MNCNRVDELMSCYIDGMLTEKEQKEFEEHINSCAQCKEEFDTLNSMVYEFNTFEEVELPEGFHVELMEKINNTEIVDIDSKKNCYDVILRLFKKRYLVPVVTAACLLLVIISVDLDFVTGDKSIKEESVNESVMEMKKSEDKAFYAETQVNEEVIEDMMDTEQSAKSMPMLENFTASDAIIVDLNEEDFKRIYYTTMNEIVESESNDKVIFINPDKAFEVSNEVFIDLIEEENLHSEVNITYSKDNLTHDFIQLDYQSINVSGENIYVYVDVYDNNYTLLRNYTFMFNKDKNGVSLVSVDVINIK